MKEVMQMCKSESTKGCEHPERLKGKPGECSPEQIKECHGDVKEHPCVEKEPGKRIERRLRKSIGSTGGARDFPFSSD